MFFQHNENPKKKNVSSNLWCECFLNHRHEFDWLIDQYIRQHILYYELHSDNMGLEPIPTNPRRTNCNYLCRNILQNSKTIHVSEVHWQKERKKNHQQHRHTRRPFNRWRYHTYIHKQKHAPNIKHWLSSMSERELVIALRFLLPSTPLKHPYQAVARKLHHSKSFRNNPASHGRTKMPKFSSTNKKKVMLVVVRSMFSKSQYCGNHNTTIHTLPPFIWISGVKNISLL